MADAKSELERELARAEMRAQKKRNPGLFQGLSVDAMVKLQNTSDIFYTDDELGLTDIKSCFIEAKENKEKQYFLNLLIQPQEAVRFVKFFCDLIEAKNTEQIAKYLHLFINFLQKVYTVGLADGMHKNEFVIILDKHADAVKKLISGFQNVTRDYPLLCKIFGISAQTEPQLVKKQ